MARKPSPLVLSYLGQLDEADTTPSTASTEHGPQSARPLLDEEKQVSHTACNEQNDKSLDKEKGVSSKDQGSFGVSFIAMTLLSIIFSPWVCALLLCCFFSLPNARAGARYGLSLGFVLWGTLFLVTQCFITPRVCHDFLLSQSSSLNQPDFEDYVKKICQTGSLVLLVLGGVHLAIGALILCTALVKRKKRQ
jgi:hypothetical protein